jgi:hypothetical protein
MKLEAVIDFAARHRQPLGWLLALAFGVVKVDQRTPLWTVLSPPSWVLGGVTPDTNQQFGVVVGVLMPSDQVIAVGDGAAATIRFFRYPGSLIRTVGRSGNGPGEFRELSWIGECGRGSFVAVDGATLRLTRFDSAGRVTHSRSSPSPFVILRPLICLAGGSIIASYDVPGTLPGKSGVFRTSGLLVSIHSDFLALDTIAVFAGTERYVSREVGGYGELPLGLTGLAAAGPSIAVVGATDSSWLTVHELAGGHVQRVRIPLSAHRVTQTEFAAAVAARLRDEPTPRIRERLAQVYASAPLPSGIRYLRRLKVDGLNRIWIETFEAASAGKSVWLVLDMNGKPLGRIELPADARIMHADDENLLLRLPGAERPEEVRLYHLRRQ